MISRRSLFRPITTLALALFSSDAALAQTTSELMPVAPESAVLHYHVTDTSPERVADARVKWQSACQVLSQTLHIGRGPFGQGVFKSAVCYFNDQPINAVNVMTPGSWHIDFTHSTAKFDINVGRDVPAASAGEKARRSERGRLELPATDSALEILADAGFADLLSYWILQVMPMSYWLEQRLPPYDPTTGKVRGRAPNDSQDDYQTVSLPDPPAELTLFALQFNKTSWLWQPTVMGKAKRIANDRNGAVWQLDTNAMTRLQSGKGLWAQNTYGSGDQVEESVERIRQAWTDLPSAVRDKYPSFMLLRFGKPILTGDTLLRRANLFGLLMEKRSGFLTNWRLYLDVVPQVTATYEDLPVSFGWQRLIIGRAFIWKFNWFFNGFEVTPKVGIWSFTTALPSKLTTLETQPDGTIRTVTDPATTNAKIDKAATLAVEAGIYRRKLAYAARAWASYDSALKISSKSGSVSSQRLGIDLYWTGRKSFLLFGSPRKFGLLAFSMYEIINLIPPISDAEPGVDQIDRIGFANAYAGFGAGLSW